ncbi:MAG: hypothetical protein HY298_23695 [Verrucomicrobia bacterium]|nr:hypothetical protein [Verrucomicrobiota bacterium]
MASAFSESGKLVNEHILPNNARGQQFIMKSKCLFILAVCFSAVFDVRSQDQFTNGLVAYYPFNGNANDASGNGNNATPAGNYQYLANGLSGGALRIIGDSSQYYSGGGYVMLPAFGSYMNSGYSVSLWVKDEVIGFEPVGAEAYITFQSDQSSYPHCQIFLLNGNPARVSFEINDTVNYATFDQTINMSNYAIAGKHLLLVSAPGRFACYFNGSKIYETNIFLNNIFPAPFAALGRHLWQPGSSSARMSATYDNVRIYNRALSDSEVNSLYVYELNLGPPVPSPNSPVGTWEMAIGGNAKGIGFLTFSPDSTLSGYAITANSFGLFTISGAWAFDGAGRIVGWFTDQQDGQSEIGSFIATAKSGRKLQGSAVTANGSFRIKGTPAVALPNLSGHYIGYVKEQGQTFTEVYDLTPGSYPGVFDIWGYASLGFDIYGALIISSRNRVNGYAISDYGAQGTLISSLSGKANPIKGTGKLKGLDQYGTPFTITITPY